MMPDVTITVSDNRWTALTAYVASLQAASEAVPPPFPPVTPPASVEALVASFVEAAGVSIEYWYQRQTGGA
jgi:hypothetical protein